VILTEEKRELGHNGKIPGSIFFESPESLGIFLHECIYYQQKQKIVLKRVYSAWVSTKLENLEQ
jgi:hypothetical protein